MLQFMLDTSLSDAEKFPLKFSDLVITSVNPTQAPDSVVWCSDPRNVLKDLPTVGLPGDYFYSPMQLQGEWSDYAETICSVDPSGRGTDETAATFISQKNGFLYVHEVRAYRDGYCDNTLLDILRGCRKYNVSKLVIETNFGDGIVSELFRKHLQQAKLNIGIEEVRATVRKEERIIDALEPVMNQHRLIIDRANARHHVAFGFGVHRCMGNRLAEMQLRIIWEEIMNRFRWVEVVGEETRLKSNFIRGIKALPVRVHRW